MPKILAYTPPWLSRPAPGAKIFSDPEPQSPVSPSKRSSYFNTPNDSPSTRLEPRRLIASRGTEIFTVVGNKIRWANLSTVKDNWEEHKQVTEREDDEGAYRTLITPVYYRITQLILSPSGFFLAICTEHTVHIAVLPDSSRLADKDRSPIKLKTYQLGPTTHVIPEAPLASVLWHPLAASGASTDCLVTVTTEAAVRVWEVDRANHWSFERPALAIDMRKLADGVSSDQDFEPSGFGKNRGFSVDAFEMEAAAACFGGQGFADEDGWAAMTLWTAMANGDVYALCPLLPSKWQPSTTTIAALSISAVSFVSSLDSKTDSSDVIKAAQQQYEWVQELDNKEEVNGTTSFDGVFNRPSNPSAIPRLQGPFELLGMDSVEGNEVSDILVIAARLDEDALLSGEDDYEMVATGLQFSIVCLATTTRQLYVSVELEGVSGQWLPQKGRSTFTVPVSDSHDLTLLEKINIGEIETAPQPSWLMISPSLSDPYSFYVTSPDRMHSVSLGDWAARVGIETSGDGDIDSGLDTRLSLACQGFICVSQELLALDNQANTTSLLSAPTAIGDLDLGSLLISCTPNQACVVFLEQNTFGQSTLSIPASDSSSPLRSSMALVKMLDEDIPDPIPTRAPYTPSPIFYMNHMQPYEELRKNIPIARRSLLAEKPLRLSPACLDIMTLAHRIFSQQTASIEKAAAELFRRCERLREELADQVKQMSELADRIQHISSASGATKDTTTLFEERLSAAQERQKKIMQRYEVLRRKSARAGSANRELSAKEHVWIDEIETLAKATGVDVESQENHDSLAFRYEAVHTLATDLLEQSKEITKHAPSPQKEVSRAESPSLRSSTSSISTRLQKERIAQVMGMVEREGAIIDAVMGRLNKLSVG